MSIGPGRRGLGVLVASAFLLNLAWEFGVCELFYVEKLFPQTPGGMLWVTAGDVIMTLVIFVLSVRVRSRGLRYGSAAGWGVLLAAIVELHALRTDRWGYTGLMPVIPPLGVGVLPLVQLALLPVLSIALAERSAPGHR